MFDYVGSSLLCGLFSSCGKWGILSGAGSRLLTVAFSLLWDTGSRSQGQWLQCMDLTALRHVGSSRARD